MMLPRDLQLGKPLNYRTGPFLLHGLFLFFYFLVFLQNPRPLGAFFSPSHPHRLLSELYIHTNYGREREAASSLPY